MTAFNWHKLFSGRLRIWYVSNQRDFWNAVLLTVLVMNYLVATTMQHNEQLEQERMQRHRAENEALACSTVFSSLPSVVFMIDARTPRDLESKLAALYTRTVDWRLALPPDRSALASRGASVVR